MPRSGGLISAGAFNYVLLTGSAPNTGSTFAHGAGTRAIGIMLAGSAVVAYNGNEFWAAAITGASVTVRGLSTAGSDQFSLMLIPWTEANLNPA